MKTFTIENETNNITLHATGKEAEGVLNSERFSNEATLAKLAANWPTARLVEIWNSLPGVTPVTKFANRKLATERIWKALQSLAQAGSEVPQAEAEPVIETPEQGDNTTVAAEIAAEVAEPVAAEPEAQPQVDEPAILESPEGDVPAPVATQTPDVATEPAPAKTRATRAKKTHVAGTAPGTPREGSKTSQVIAMLKREGGTTLEEIMTAMGWQKHTTRAMLSAGGSLVKKHGLVIVSEKVGEKRVYSIKP
jgi:hypothetical protein